MAHGHWLKDYIGPHSGGSGGGGTEPLIVKSNYDESTDVNTLDHTWQEIYDAVTGGRTVLLEEIGIGMKIRLLIGIEKIVDPSTGAAFRVKFGYLNDYYIATSADDYPTMDVS